MMDQEINPTIRRSVNYLQGCAKDGLRIQWHADDAEKPKTIWGGLGNRAGLHSFAYTLLDEKWTKSGANFTKKVSRILEGEMGSGQLLILSYRAKTRDRGNWVTVRRIKV